MSGGTAGNRTLRADGAMVGDRSGVAGGAAASGIVGCLLAALALLGGGPLEAGEGGGESAARSDRTQHEQPEALPRAVRRYEIGQGPRSYWLFEPDQPRPETAPVVVFLHG